MTFAIGSGTKDIQQIKNTSADMSELPIQEGDSFEAKVTGVTEDSLTLDFVKNGSHESIDIATSNTTGLSIDDRVKVEVLAFSKDELKLSITKLTEVQTPNSIENIGNTSGQIKTQSMPESHGARKINLDELKKIIIETNNPLQYSKQLDQHIEQAITQVETMLQSFSDDDLQVLIDENYDLSKMTVDLLYQVGHSPRIDKKIALIGDKDLEMSITVNEKAINELIKEGAKNTFLTQVPEEVLKETLTLLVENDIKPNLSNIEKVVRFTEKVDKIQEIGSKELIQFLSSNKDNTIAELYKSIYINNGKEKKDVLTDADYKEIEIDVKSIVEQFFGNQNENQDELLTIAKSIVMKGLALDERALTTLEFTQRNMNYRDKAQMAISQIQKGLKPETIEISDKRQSALMTKEEIRKSLNVIKTATNQMVKELVEEGKAVTINNLSVLIKEYSPTVIQSDLTTVETNKSPEVKSPAIVEVVSREIENLEILRYQMTFKAAMRLNIQGLDLANTQLDVLRNRIEGFSDTNGPITVSTKDVIDETSPERIKGTTSVTVLQMNRYFSLINGSSTETIANIALEENTVESISSIAGKVTRGIDRYDQLRTMPRPDLGDKIEKAFSNIEAILEDLSLEKSPFNQRAVEILGRNEMSINIASIEAVKTLDIQIQELMNRLTPAHVQALIKENIDVLTEPIDQLLTAVNQIDNEFSIKTIDTIEKSLYQLFKKEDLSESMRSSLVGVYRMLNTIENSKGAAIGFLMEHELPVTLETLYDASKYIRSTKNTVSKIESNIDDSFGILESIEQSAPTIKEQIRTGYFEKQQDLELVIKQLLGGSYTETRPSVTSDFQNLGSDILGALKNIKSEIDQSDIEYTRQVLKGFSEKDKALIKEGSVIESSITQPLKIKEWEALKVLEKDPFAFKTLATDLYQSIVSDETLRNRFETALDKLKENPSLEEKLAFEKTINGLMNEVKQKIVEQTIDQNNNQEVRNQMHQLAEREVSKPFTQLEKEIESQLAVQRYLMKQDYFQIPLMVNGQIQQMNMYFLGKDTSTSETEDSMSIYFSFSTQNIGTTNIRVQLNNDDVDVTIYSTVPEGAQLVKSFEGQFMEVFSSIGFKVNRLKYDSFTMPKAVGQDLGMSQLKQLKKYQESRFESIV